MKASLDNAPVFVAFQDFLGWLLDRVEGFPKSQRFVFGQRLANRGLDTIELILEALYSRDKLAALEQAGRNVEVLRILLRLCADRKLIAAKQYAFASGRLAEIGAMIGGWIKQQRRK